VKVATINPVFEAFVLLSIRLTTLGQSSYILQKSVLNALHRIVLTERANWECWAL